jgi:hypothetical protein
MLKRSCSQRTSVATTLFYLNNSQWSWPNIITIIIITTIIITITITITIITITTTTRAWRV